MSRRSTVCLLLALITVLIYLPVRHHAFVAYDDPGVVSENSMVQAGLTWAGVRWAFTSTQTGNWHPVTWLSHMLDCQLFGLNAGAHHLVGVTLHAGNAVLLFLLLLYLTGSLWPSSIVAASFAWHPLRVQSVAWAAERKDVLSAFFALLTLTAYARYARASSPVESHGSAGVDRDQTAHRRASVAYALALAFFALGLMAKPMLVTLPFLMLLLDFWPLARLAARPVVHREQRHKRAKAGRSPRPAFSKNKRPLWRGLLIEKWPFFALSALFCGLALWAQAEVKALIPLARYSLETRLGNALIAYVNYLLKTIYPTDLAFFYPPSAASWLAAAGAVAVLAGISWTVWRERRIKPYLLVGWLWFLGMLVPVIGLVQVGDQTVADRYTYLPSIGLSIGVVFWLADMVTARQIKGVVWGSLVTLTLAGFLWATSHQLQFWRDSETLFAHAVDVTQNNTVALSNLGAILLQQGRVEQAVDRFRQAAAAASGNAEANNNLGLALARLGRFEEAETAYRQALQLDPEYGRAYENLGSALLQTGRILDAIVSLRRAIEIFPSDAKAFNDLGVAFMKIGRAGEGLSSFRRALELQPSNAQFRRNLVNALLQEGHVDEARVMLESLPRTPPTHPE